MRNRKKSAARLSRIFAAVSIGFLPIINAQAQEMATPLEGSIGISESTIGSTLAGSTPASGILSENTRVESTLAPLPGGSPVVEYAPLPVAPVNAGAGLADARNLAGAVSSAIDLEDVIVQVILNNPQRSTALATLRAAQARIGTARSQGGPQVNLSGNAGFSRDFNFLSSSGNSSSNNNGNGGQGNGGIGGGDIGGGSSFNNNGSQIFGFEATQSLGVDASIPIYNGGRVKAGRRLAEAQARAAAAQTVQTSQDLVRTAIETYLNILRGQQLLLITESNLDVSRERLRVSQVRFTAGAAARLEVLRANTTLADAAQERVQASNSLAQFKSALNILMARDPETPLNLEMISAVSPRVPIPLSQINISRMEEFGNPGGGSTPVAATVVPIDNPSGQELRDIADASRPALDAGREQIEAAEQNVDVAKAARKPSLGLSLGGLLRNPANFLGNFALSFGLGLAQNLFDSGRSRSQIREAQAFVDQARGNLQTQRLNVANQIEQSLLNLDASAKRADLSEASVVEAREALRAAQLGYEAGAQTSLEVNDAQFTLLRAQNVAVNARFDVANARNQLSSAVGVLTAEGQQAYELALKEEEAREKQNQKKN